MWPWFSWWWTAAVPVRPVWPPRVVGVDYGLQLVARRPLPSSAIAQRITVTPAVPWRLLAEGRDHWQVDPLALWPAHTTLRIHYRGDPPWTVTMHVGADKWVAVDLTHQTATAYVDLVPVRTMRVATGVAPDWVTPTGRFWIFRKVADDRMRGGEPGRPGSWDVAHVPYAQYFYRGVAFHGAWWTRRFGVPQSHGCVQLATRMHNPDPRGVPEDAGWLWHFTNLGTLVVVTGKTPTAPPLPRRPPAPVPGPPPSGARSAASSIP